MTEVRFLSDFTSHVTGTKTYDTPFGRFVDVIRVAEIDSTVRTTWPLIERSGQGDRADVSSASITVPSGAMIIGMGIRIPPTTLGGTASGLVATNSDRLKLAVAVANNTRDWTANDGTKCNVVTAVAASSTFVAQAVEQTRMIGDDSALAVRLASDATFELYNDNGTTALGSGVSVAANTIALVVVRIMYQIPMYIPTAQQCLARPAKPTQGVTYIPAWA
jgi:hypothetical protein